MNLFLKEMLKQNYSGEYVDEWQTAPAIITSCMLCSEHSYNNILSVSSMELHRIFGDESLTRPLHLSGFARAGVLMRIIVFQK